MAGKGNRRGTKLGEPNIFDKLQENSAVVDIKKEIKPDNLERKKSLVINIPRDSSSSDEKKSPIRYSVDKFTIGTMIPITSPTHSSSGESS